MTRATMMTIATPPTTPPTRAALPLLLMMMMLPLTLSLLAPSVDVCDVAPVADVVVPGAVLSPDFAETQGCFIVFLCNNKNLKQE